MPSGVSHGSALAANPAGAAFSNAIFAKFGMRLMGYQYSTADGPGRHPSIMVRMLVADDGSELFRPVILQRGLARQVGDADPPAEPGFGAILPGRHQLVGAVEGPRHDLDPRAADTAEAQGRAAVGAEIAHRDGRGLERRRLAAGPAEIRM